MTSVLSIKEKIKMMILCHSSLGGIGVRHKVKLYDEDG